MKKKKKKKRRMLMDTLRPSKTKYEYLKINKKTAPHLFSHDLKSDSGTM